jgi:hypothetical protein
MIGSAAVKDLIAFHGSVRSQGPAEWSGSIDCPEELLRYYAHIGPDSVTIEGYGNPYFLPSLSDLWSFQAGYRWNGLTNEPISDWPNEWLVVADEGGDPFIYSTSSKSVLFAHHGEGSWEADQLFSSVEEMAACLATLGRIVAEAGDAFTDDLSYIRPEHYRSAAAALTKILGASARADDVLAQLGWG